MFIPQRLWVAVALSCAMVAVLVVVACSLTDELIATIHRAVADLIALRAQVLATVKDALATSVALNNQYLQMVLNGAAGVALAGPAVFTSQQVTSATVSAFVNGQANTVVDAVALAAGGGAAAATGAAVAQVTVDAYLQAALAAASGVAGQLPAALDSAVGAAPGIAEEQLGVQLSAAGLATAAVAGAEGMLVSQVPGGADILRNLLVLSSPSFWQELGGKLTANVTTANALAIAAGVALVTGTWVAMLTSYMRKVRRARAGVYPFLYKRVNIGGASRFLGVQASLTALSFLLTYAIVFVLYVVLSLPGLLAYLWATGQTLILSLLGVSLALRILEQILLYYALARGDTIRYRRLYMLADLWVSFLSTVVGFIVAILRFVPFLPLACLALMRTDISVVGPAMESFDSAKAVYNAMLLQDTQYSHPIKYTFGLLMMQVLAARRAAVPGGGGGGASALSPRKVTNPLSARPLRGVASSDGSAGGGGGGAGGGVGVEDETRRRRVRNRWHLAVLLAANPSLREFRVRDLPLRARQERVATGRCRRPCRQPCRSRPPRPPRRPCPSP